jgi:hypothetical protein
MKDKQQFKLLIEMDALVIDDYVLFTNASPIENKNKK